MAKPFQEGSGWAFRLRAQGQDIYQSGFASQAAANKAQAELLAELKQTDQADGQGPFKTTVAAAFTCYAREKLPYLKGALPDSRIINRYLRALNLPVILLRPTNNSDKQKGPYWEVSFVAEDTRTIPKAWRNTAQRKKPVAARSTKHAAGLPPRQWPK